MALRRIQRNLELLRSIIFMERSFSQEPIEAEENFAFLFKLEDTLIEHKFPANKAGIHEYIISAAAGIYREMARPSPHYPYIAGKLDILTKYVSLGALTEGDWREVGELMKGPSYRLNRDEYLSNLKWLREETVKTPMDQRRKDVMTESLDMIEALIFWFETLDPKAAPKYQLNSLVDAVATYFGFPTEIKGSYPCPI